MFPFLESIRIEKRKVALLDLHEKRMDTSLAFLGKKKKYSLASILAKQDIQSDEVYKLRIEYNEEEYQHTLTPYQEKEIKRLRIVYDNTIDYSYKWTNRSKINEVFSQREEADDVIIVKNEMLCDTSYANIILYNGKEWHTPKTALLKGVMRNFLLEKKSIVEKNIYVDDIKDYQKIMLINAMLPLNIKRAKDINTIVI